MATTQTPTSAGLQPTGVSAPTRVRYGVLLFLCTLSLVLYLDRVCIGQAEISMRNDLGLDKWHMGLVFWAFLLPYALFEVPTGRLGDRFGSRGVLTRIVLWWSAFTALTGAVFSLPVLILVRFLFGAGEAGAFPNAARVVARWFPLRSRSTAQGAITTSAGIGGALAPVFAAYLIKLIGWRCSFVVFGGVGVVWAAAFYYWFRDDPAEHSRVNDAERQLIAVGRSTTDLLASHSPIPWGCVLRSPNVWLMGLIMNCGAAAFYMYIGWYPTYLKEGREVALLLSGWLSGAVLAAGAIGSTLGGYVVDRLMRASGNRVWTRRVIGGSRFSLAGLSLVASIQFHSPVLSTVFVAFACFGVQMQIACWWGVVTEISGRHLGALFGLMNSMGVVGSSCSLVLLPLAVESLAKAGHVGRAQWDPAFYAYAGVMLVAAVAWLFVDPSKSAVEAADEPSLA